MGLRPSVIRGNLQFYFYDPGSVSVSLLYPPDHDRFDHGPCRSDTDGDQHGDGNTYGYGHIHGDCDGDQHTDKYTNRYADEYADKYANCDGDFHKYADQYSDGYTNVDADQYGNCHGDDYPVSYSVAFSGIRSDDQPNGFARSGGRKPTPYVYFVSYQLALRTWRICMPRCEVWFPHGRSVLI